MLSPALLSLTHLYPSEIPVSWTTFDSVLISCLWLWFTYHFTTHLWATSLSFQWILLFLFCYITILYMLWLILPDQLCPVPFNCFFVWDLMVPKSTQNVILVSVVLAKPFLYNEWQIKMKLFESMCTVKFKLSFLVWPASSPFIAFVFG